ncbi:MAG TPA: ElyC/SanA/YdcF family protein [Polyangia bacterium]|nr:ElyC/SanA/YdcF family protein [Polyangia bacterium]
MNELVLPTPLVLCVSLAAVCSIAFRRRARWRWLLLAALAWAYCFSTPAIATVLVAALERQYPATATPAKKGEPLILVLSSGIIVETPTGWQVRLDKASWERSFAAVRLWRQIGGQLLFIGGPSPDGSTSVAAAMRDVAVTAGVPAAALHVEARSRDTHENLALNRAVIAAHGDDVWLVTSAMHLPRAMAVAHKLGMSPHAQPCDWRDIPRRHWWAWIPDSGGPTMFAAALHEWLGLATYRLRGWT